MKGASPELAMFFVDLRIVTQALTLRSFTELCIFFLHFSFLCVFYVIIQNSFKNEEAILFTSWIFWCVDGEFTYLTV